MEKIFKNIYDNKIWGGGSGTGSKYTPDNKFYLKVMGEFLEKFNLKTICDIGCGDWEIMKHFDFDGVDYTGFDIVDSVIEFNRKNYGKENVRFVCENMMDNIPKGFDLVVIKDVLQHHNDIVVETFLDEVLKHNNYVFIVNGYKFMRKPEKNTWTKRVLDKKYHYHPIDLTRKPLNKFEKYVKDVKHRRAKEYILFKKKLIFKKL